MLFLTSTASSAETRCKLFAEMASRVKMNASRLVMADFVDEAASMVAARGCEIRYFIQDSTTSFQIGKGIFYRGNFELGASNNIIAGSLCSISL